MITLGNLRVVFNETLLVPDNQEITFEADIGAITIPLGQVGMVDLKVRFTLRFNPNAETQQVHWEGDLLNGVRINFDRWQNTLGTTFNSPQPLGALPAGQTLFFFVFHHRVGTTNRFDFQLLI